MQRCRLQYCRLVIILMKEGTTAEPRGIPIATSAARITRQAGRSRK